MEDILLEGLMYALPALVTGAIAFYFFSGYIKQTHHLSEMDMLTEKKKQSLPIKLQAYERMLLFCERIHPVKLLIRVQPVGSATQEYLQLLLSTIEQEFEHNMVQQLYLSDTSWNALLTTKTAILNKLTLLAKDSTDATAFRAQVLDYYQNNVSPTLTAIAVLKTEAKKLL